MVYNESGQSVISIKSGVDLYIRGKLRVLALRNVAPSSSNVLVTISQVHAPYSQVYQSILVTISNKHYLGFITTAIASNMLNIHGYYIPTYGTGNTAMGNTTTVYGVIVWFTA